MKKVELEKLKTKILKMTNNDQLELMKLLLNELNERELVDNKSELDDLIRMLHVLVNSIEMEIQKDKLLLLISEVGELSSNYQKKLIIELRKLIISLQIAQEKELGCKECQENGHDYTKWERMNYYDSERNPNFRISVDALEGMEYICIQNVIWERSCRRCGVVESVKHEPQEVIEEKTTMRRILGV